MSTDYRIGFGYDLHKLVPGRDLILGNVKVPHDQGLSGHSDADIVLHAIIDALLGAAGLPDIGEQFPDTDETWKNANSADLARRVMQLLSDDNWQVNNIDVTIVAQQPKLSPHKQAIRIRVAELFETDPSRVSIKAKTNEGVDAVGTGAAMAGYASASITKYQR